MLFFPFDAPFVPFLLFGIAFAAIWLYQRNRRNARTTALAAVAMGINFEFSVIDTYGIETMPFALFRQGNGQKATNVMSGTYNGRPLKMFDYEYYVQGRNREYHRFTCAILTIPAACPWMCLTHENALTRLGDHLGIHDVELEYDDFNRRFKVSCDQKFAFTMLDGKMMEWLLGADRFDRVEVIGPWVLVVQRTLPANAWTSLGLWLDAFSTHIPPLVYSSYPVR